MLTGMTLLQVLCPSWVKVRAFPLQPFRIDLKETYNSRSDSH